MTAPVLGAGSPRRELAHELDLLDDAVAAARAFLRRQIGAEFALVGPPTEPEGGEIACGALVALTGGFANVTYAVVCDPATAAWIARRRLDFDPDDEIPPMDLAAALNEIPRAAAEPSPARRIESGERRQPGLPLFVHGSSWLTVFGKGVRALAQRLAGPEGVGLQIVLLWQSGVKPGGVPLPTTRERRGPPEAAGRPVEVLREAARAVVDTCEIQLGLTFAVDPRPADPRDTAVDCGSSIALTARERGGWHLAVMGRRDSCARLTRILFAMDADEEATPEDLADGVGEIANVAAGVFKASRLEAGEQLQVGLPLFMEGRGCIDASASRLQGLAQRLHGPEGIELHVILFWQDAGVGVGASAR